MSKRKTTSYASEFKESSAKLAVNSDITITETAENLGISASTLHGWVNKYYPNKNKTLQSNVLFSPIEELKKLKKENSRLRQERDILKKAAAYFAREIK
jgi:transposase